MTDKIKLLPILIIIAVILLSSCGAGTTDRLTADDVKSIEDYVMSSYFILRGDESLPESRAAWPAHTTELIFPAPAGSTTQAKQGFPEKGQRTTVTITNHTTAGIFFVENVTTYPRREDVLSGTTESYYVKDVTPGDESTPDGFFNEHDLLWDIDGDVRDFNKRVKFETEYQDGTDRYEFVEATTTEDTINYAAFNINGNLTFPEGDSWSPPVAASNYSSMVSYVQEDLNELDFWSGNKVIVGTRYYTEHGDLAKPTKTSVSYERVYAVDSIPADLKADASTLIDGLYSGLGDVLAETVIRYQITSNNKKFIRTQTRLFDSTDGASVVTFSAYYVEESDGTVTEEGAPVAAY